MVCVSINERKTAADNGVQSTSRGAGEMNNKCATNRAGNSYGMYALSHITVRPGSRAGARQVEAPRHAWRGR